MKRFISHLSLAFLANISFNAISMEKRTPEGTSNESTPSFKDPSVAPLIETMQRLLSSDQPNDNAPATATPNQTLTRLLSGPASQFGALASLSAQLSSTTSDAQMKDLVAKLQGILPAYTNFLGVFTSIAQEENDAYTVDLRPFGAAASKTKLSLDDVIDHLTSTSNFQSKHNDFVNFGDALYNDYLSKAKSPVLVQRYLDHPACNRLTIAIQLVNEYKTRSPHGPKLFESATALRATLEKVREKAHAAKSDKMDPATFFAKLQNS